MSFAPLVQPKLGPGGSARTFPLRESRRRLDPNALVFFFSLTLPSSTATYEVRSLQELARLCIRHVLRVTPDGGASQSRDRGSSFSVGRGLAVAGLHKYGPRFKRRRIHRRHCNALLLATRQVVASSGIGPAPSDSSYRGEQVEDEEAGEREERRQVRGSRKAGRGAVAVEDETLEDELVEEEEQEEEKETGELLRPQPALNVLRQRVLGLPLPEPLKMYLLFYREK